MSPLRKQLDCRVGFHSDRNRRMTIAEKVAKLLPQGLLRVVLKYILVFLALNASAERLL